MKKLVKECFVCMLKTYKRFLSILVIILLGVGFFAGIRAVSPDMKKTLDDYYNQNNVYDLYITSNMGIPQETIDLLSKKYKSQPSYTMDSLVKTKEEETAKILSLDYNQLLNQPKLVKGTLPTTEKECVVDSQMLSKNMKIGDYITIESDGLKNNKLKIVGFAESPIYISKDRGTTALLSGTIDYFIYVPTTNIKLPIYTEIYLKIDTTESRFSKEYQTQIKTEKKKIKQQLEGKHKNAKWYVLDIESNSGFYQYKQDSERIDNVAKVFPLVFFIVAILICLTTMTRMVEEERTQIGTLKSLGYNNISIIFKYVLYALLATIIGAIVGVMIGFRILPEICFNMYKVIYTLGDIQLQFYPSLMFQGIFIAILCTLTATIYTCIKTLKSSPTELLRPRSPDPGKRVFLERIKPIWTKLTFSNKVTIRNVFRYKKRFLMTIIGIAGCTGLILAGFGLKDCVGRLVPKQYEELSSYQLTIALKNISQEQKEQDITTIKQQPKVTKILKTAQESIKITNKKTNQTITLIVPFDPIEDFITLKNRKTNQAYSLENGLIVTEKIAKLLNIKIGDMLSLTGEKEYTGKVKNITENYFSHYIYMPNKIYNSLDYNTLLVKTKKMTTKEEKQLAKTLKELPSISNITFTSDTKHVFDETMNSFASISLILIISAGALALVVLYNLASVNISERRRELATIKVLGFHDKEVYKYIARETFILTALGILVGLIVGNLLTAYIIKTCEVDTLMFDPKIAWPSYIYAIVITVIFTMLVNIIIYFSLQKIDMIESLKSVE